MAKGTERESSRERKDKIPQQHGLPRGHAAVLRGYFVTIIILMHEKVSLSLSPVMYVKSVLFSPPTLR